ncbi:alcohol dehydogenase [Abortiporus biennis]|nr:alcohol dehydogenase [Abortiporus biennis]
MIAYRWVKGEPKPIREIIPVPSPGPGEVLVKVQAAGVCHSDITIMQTDRPAFFPQWERFTLGHEGAGTIVAVDPSVSQSHPSLKVDTYVAILGCNPCFERTCNFCSGGKDQLCRMHPKTTNFPYGLGRDGSWAQYVVVQAACIIPVPAEGKAVPPAAIAVSTDAVLTPYHALTTCMRVKSGQTVLVIGSGGGLGLHTIQIAKNCIGAKVIGCDVRPTALSESTRLGADFVGRPEDIAEILQKNSLIVDGVVDMVATQQSFELGLTTVKEGGIIHILGLDAEILQVPVRGLMFKDLALQSSFWGTKQELAEVLEHVAAGRIKPEVETRSMELAGEVLEEMRSGKLKKRVALIP